MKKILKILIYVILAFQLVVGLAYISYEPKDFCSEADILQDIYDDLSSKLGLTYVEYVSLSKFRQNSLVKKNTDYLKLKVSYDIIKEKSLLCSYYKNVSKYERFKIDVSSGNYFKN